MTIEFISHESDQQDLSQKAGQFLLRPWRKLTNGPKIHVLSVATGVNKEFVKEVKSSLISKICSVFWNLLATLTLPATLCLSLLGKIALHYSLSYADMFARYQIAKENTSIGEYETVRLQFHSIKQAGPQENYPIEFQENFDAISNFAKENTWSDGERFKIFKKGSKHFIHNKPLELPGHMILEREGAFHLICPLKIFEKSDKTPKAHVHSYFYHDETDDYKEVFPKLSKSDLMKISWDAFRLEAPQSTFKHFHEVPGQCVHWKDTHELNVTSFNRGPDQLVMIKKDTCQLNTAVSISYLVFDEHGNKSVKNEEIPSSATFSAFLTQLRTRQLATLGQKAKCMIRSASIQTEEDNFKKIGDLLISAKSEYCFEIKGYSVPQGKYPAKEIRYDDLKAIEAINKYASQYCNDKLTEISKLITKDNLAVAVVKDKPTQALFDRHPQSVYLVEDPNLIFLEGVKIYTLNFEDQSLHEEVIKVDHLNELVARLKAIVLRQANEYEKKRIEAELAGHLLPVDNTHAIKELIENQKDQVFIQLGNVNSDKGSVSHSIHFFNPFKNEVDHKTVTDPKLKCIKEEIETCKRLQIAFQEIHSVQGVIPLSCDTVPSDQVGVWSLRPQKKYQSYELHYTDASRYKWCFSLTKGCDLKNEYTRIKSFFDHVPESVELLKQGDSAPTVGAFKNESGFDFAKMKVKLDASANKAEIYQLNPFDLKVECKTVSFSDFVATVQNNQEQSLKRVRTAVDEIKNKFNKQVISKKGGAHVCRLSLDKPRYYLIIDENNATVTVHFWNRIKLESDHYVLLGYDIEAIDEKIEAIDSCYALHEQIDKVEKENELLKANKIAFFNPDKSENALSYKSFSKKNKAFYVVSPDYKKVRIYYLNSKNTDDVLSLSFSASQFRAGIEQYLLRIKESQTYDLQDSFFRDNLSEETSITVTDELEAARQHVFHKTLIRISKDNDPDIAKVKVARYAEDLNDKGIKIAFSKEPNNTISDQKIYSGICRSPNEVYGEFKSRVSISDFLDAFLKNVNKSMPANGQMIYDEFLERFGETLLNKRIHPRRCEELESATKVYHERLKEISNCQERGDNVIADLVTKHMLNWEKDLNEVKENPTMVNPAGEPSYLDPVEKVVKRIYWNAILKIAHEFLDIDQKFQQLLSNPTVNREVKSEELSKLLIQKTDKAVQATREIDQLASTVNQDLINEAKVIFSRERRRILKDVVIKEGLFSFEPDSDDVAYPVSALRPSIKLIAIADKLIKIKHGRS